MHPFENVMETMICVKLDFSLFIHNPIHWREKEFFYDWKNPWIQCDENTTAMQSDSRTHTPTQTKVKHWTTPTVISTMYYHSRCYCCCFYFSFWLRSNWSFVAIAYMRRFFSCTNNKSVHKHRTNWTLNLFHNRCIRLKVYLQIGRSALTRNSVILCIAVLISSKQRNFRLTKIWFDSFHFNTFWLLNTGNVTATHFFGRFSLIMSYLGRFHSAHQHKFAKKNLSIVVSEKELPLYDTM